MQVRHAEVREVPITELLAKGRELFVLNHREAGHVLEASYNPPLDIDDAMFVAMDRAGALLALGLFADDNQLVGYSIATVYKHPWAAEHVCSVTVIFVESAHRRNGNARHLMDETERRAFERGVARVNWHAHDPGVEALLRQRGARQLETTYSVVRK